MKITRFQVATVFVSALMVMAAVTGGALAAMTYDNETANTGTTSEWQEGTTVTDLDNSSKTATLEVQSDNATDGDGFTLRAVVADNDSAQNGETIYETTQSWTATNSSQGHYETNVTHSAVFENLERDANETVAVDIVTVWNESQADEEQATIQISAHNGDEPRLIADDRTEMAEPNAGLLAKAAFWSSDEDTADAARLEENVSVTENTTTLRVAENDANVSDAISAATEDTESGELTTDAYVKVNDAYVPVFDQSAEVDWLDTSTQTYAVADGTGVTINNVNESYDNASTVDIVVAANANLGIMDTASMLEDSGANKRTAFKNGIGAGYGATFEADEMP